jgi:hypothetical protein
VPAPIRALLRVRNASCFILLHASCRVMVDVYSSSALRIREIKSSSKVATSQQNSLTVIIHVGLLEAVTRSPKSSLHSIHHHRKMSLFKFTIASNGEALLPPVLCFGLSRIRSSAWRSIILTGSLRDFIQSPGKSAIVSSTATSSLILNRFFIHNHDTFWRCVGLQSMQLKILCLMTKES